MVSSRSGILMGTGQSDLPRPSTGKEAQAAVSGNGGLALLNPQADIQDQPILQLPPASKQMFQTAPGTPMSPYLTESAHVFSLQNPLKRRESRLNEIKVTESAPPIEDSLEETLSRKSSSETLIRKSSPTLAETSAYSPKKLYLKTLKTFESRFRAKHDVDQDPAHNTAAGAKGCCQIPIDKLAQLNSKSASWFKDEHGTSKFSKKIFFGKAPWHRKESGDSCSSVASSVREILRGSTPPGTPVSGYTAHYSTHSVNNQFPGGEAQRIPTPPLDEDTADGKPRGFFTCSIPPTDGGPETDSLHSRHHALSRSDIHRRSLNAPPREWWEQPPRRVVKKDTSRVPGTFEFDVPEHLPGSPLCPANQSRQGGRGGLCVYHGRSRTGTLLREETINRGSEELQDNEG
uniref:Uncharacterized protein n=1 Tax=Bionectria ochroleuca TaxID=29856 RepID=A0A0B7JPD7_BIOOC